MKSAAFISDIHSNLEALKAVLADIDRKGYQEILCLGDIVGYGPDPRPCVDLVRKRCRFSLLGNHDEALIKGPWGFNQLARNAIEWTRKRMRPRFYRFGSQARWNFLAELPIQAEWRNYLLVHGSPRDPVHEYVMKTDVILSREWKTSELRHVMMARASGPEACAKLATTSGCSCG